MLQFILIMDNKAETKEDAQPAAPTPGQVVSVVPPPPAEEKEKSQEPSGEKPVPAPPPEAGKDKTEKVKPLPTPKPQKAVTSKKPHGGVTLAIVATVIIVLGLGAMAVYAYLKTK
jgi:uncharacterized protein HemX